MTVDRLMTALAAGLAGYMSASLLARVALRSPPRRLMRTNVSGRAVPAVLGGPLVMAGLIGIAGLAAAAALGWDEARAPRMTAAIVVCLVVLIVAGRWDDLKGDERPRGFRGHLAAAGGGALTGGLVKLVAGLVAGVAAGALVADGWEMAVAAVLVAATANLVNLTDRAPGRAGKIALLFAAPLVAFGPSSWTVAAASTIGALLACLAFDLKEKAMLGDAGANPLGAVIGVGLAAALEGGVAIAAAVALVALNLASERWSYSAVIEATPWLRAPDRWGRSK